MTDTELDAWLHSIKQPGAFESYGDAPHGAVWWILTEQKPWPHSCYDTRELALKGDRDARAWMHNYRKLLKVRNAMLVALKLKQ